MNEYTDRQIINAAGALGLAVSSIRRDIDISGSPQRSEFRCVVECADQARYVMENIHPRMVDKKHAIINRLDFVAGQGLSGVYPYIRAANGEPIIQSDGRFWQASPYIPGVRLSRPGFECDSWRGEAMAEFCVSLHQKSCNIPEKLRNKNFSIVEYIRALMAPIKRQQPELHEKIRPAADFIETRLAPVHDPLPAAFCHGDYHPLNMIWSENGIRAVIDWEFSGIKPEIYDVATLIGCMGMETPDALAGPLVMAFIRDLKTSGILAQQSWASLPAFVIAIRFGWLSEWLRNRDAEMIELETVYMKLLMTHADDLKTIWSIT